MTTTSPGAGPSGPYGRASRQLALAHLRAAGTTPAFDGIAHQIQRMCAPAGNRLTKQIDGLFHDAMAPIREQINGMLREAIPPVGPDWSAQIADMPSTNSRLELFTFLNRFDEIARSNPDLEALLPDEPDTGLGEIGENGLAFVNAEGAGLVLDDAAVPSTVATAALLAATRKWDETFPRPEGDGETEDSAGE